MERELVALRGIIEQVGAEPRVIADDGVQMVLPATPNAADGARVLYGTRTKHFVMSADAGARPDVAFVQLNGLEAPAGLPLLWMAPYPPFASTRWWPNGHIDRTLSGAISAPINSRGVHVDATP